MADEVPERAPRHWFIYHGYEAGLHVERPAEDESSAVRIAIGFLAAGGGGSLKVGYRSWRSRVIVYGEDDLRRLMRQIT